MLPNLLREKKRKKITYQEMEDRTKISKSSLSNWTTGNVRIRQSIAQIIRNEFFPEYDYDYLFSEELLPDPTPTTNQSPNKEEYVND